MRRRVAARRGLGISDMGVAPTVRRHSRSQLDGIGCCLRPPDGVMDWTAVGTVLATGAVTLGSVALKGWFDDRAGKRQVAASQLEREDEEQAKAAQLERERTEALEARRRDEASAALAEFAAILGGLEALPDNATCRDVEQTWLAGLDSPGASGSGAHLLGGSSRGDCAHDERPCRLRVSVSTSRTGTGTRRRRSYAP